jgi:nicotinamide-nucleotide adenylyltransferase
MSADADLPSLVERIQSGQQAIAFPYTPHPSWPRPSSPSHTNPSSPSHTTPPTPLRIAILDSSFNPPTIAHAALLGTRPPSGGDYDARLLLLSVRNADKALKPGDATHAQRAAMMARVAAAAPRCGVALLDAPMFVDKAAVVRAGVLARLAGPAPAKVTLTWLMGLDSLERLFAPRYYPSERAMLASLDHFLDPARGENAVVCAWRGAAGAHTPEQIPALARPFVERGQVTMIALEEGMGEVSSTELRRRRAEGNEAWRTLLPAEVADYVAEKGLYIPDKPNMTE